MTAKIITVFNQKGGVGKTTTCMQLAGTLARRGHRVQVFDMDPQGTATQWAAAAEEGKPFPVKVQTMAQFKGKIHNEVQKYAEDCEFLIIDCPPALDSPVARSALTIADLALIPIAPRPADLISSSAAKDLALDAQVVNQDLRILAVANFVERNSTTREILKGLKADEQVPLAKAVLSKRLAFSDSVAYGITVHDIPDAEKAIEEIEALASEVIQSLGERREREAA